MRKRRGAGEGLIRQRKDGRWEGRIDLGWRDGKRRRKCLFAKTQAEVSQIMAAERHSIAQGAPAATTIGPTLAQFLNDWLAGIKTEVRVRSLDRYEGIVRLHLIPNLGRIKVRKLTQQHVDALLKSKLASGVAPRTVSGIRMVLQKALRKAQQWDMVTRNVVELVDGPAAPENEMNVYTPEQAATFLESCRGDRLEALYWLALAHGLRRGELLGLK
jgi:integrase